VATASDPNRWLDWLLARVGSVGYQALVYGTVAFLLAPLAIWFAHATGRHRGFWLGDHHVVENKPGAPLHEPTVLNGKMFGLPIAYERAFETSFPVDHPPRQQTLATETSSFFYSERTHAWWTAIKGIRGSYPKEHVAKNALPMPYVDCLTRSWLQHVGEAQGCADYSDYDARMDERRAREANSSLGDYVTDGGRDLSCTGDRNGSHNGGENDG